MAKDLIIIDSCVLIKAFRKDVKAMNDLKGIANHTAYSVNTYVTGQRIVSVPDCLIAATSIITGYPLLTYNKKDFDFIEGLVLFL